MISDAYWDDPTGTTEDIQATEFMEDGSMENYFNISVWEFGVVKQIIQRHMQNYYQPNN